MEVVRANDGSEAPTRASDQPDFVRTTVINNSQLIASVTRTASLTVSLALVLQLVLRAFPAGQMKDIGKTFDIALIVCGAVLLILSQFLDRALRRCPVCRTRITNRTEEIRRCLECNTELWGYWNE